MKHLLFILLIPIFLFSRENPFFPADNAEDIPLTTNQIENIEPLKRATIKLPSTARTIESVTVKYKNLDGSISSKKIQLHNSIDWHLPLFISQNYDASPERTLYKKREKVAKYKKIASLDFISFYADGKKLKVVTEDKMLRNFLLVKPHRIVCDFQRDTDFGSFVKRVSAPSLFKKIRIGTHSGYYRVVIELDGYYQYKVKKSSSGYIFTLL